MQKHSLRVAILIISLPFLVIGVIQAVLWMIGLSFRPPQKYVAGGARSTHSHVSTGSIVMRGTDTVAVIDELIVSQDRASGLRFELYQASFRNQRDAMRLRTESTGAGVVDVPQAGGPIIVHLVPPVNVAKRAQRGALVVVYPSKYIPLY